MIGNKDLQPGYMTLKMLRRELNSVKIFNVQTFV